MSSLHRRCGQDKESLGPISREVGEIWGAWAQSPGKWEESGKRGSGEPGPNLEQGRRSQLSGRGREEPDAQSPGKWVGPVS